MKIIKEFGQDAASQDGMDFSWGKICRSYADAIINFISLLSFAFPVPHFPISPMQCFYGPAAP